MKRNNADSSKTSRLLVIADDLTGAMDTGVQFFRCGFSVRLSMRAFPEGEAVCDVLVIDAESRHLTPEEAYAVSYDFAIAGKERRIPHLFVKTDSVLRGNIGPVMKAAVDAYRAAPILFAPVYPELGRMTRNGRQYVHGVPVDESDFRHDPLNPVRVSFIPDLLEPWSLTVRNYRLGERLDLNAQKENVALLDIEKPEDFSDFIGPLLPSRLPRVMAGCAGFAAALCGAWKQAKKKNAMPPVQGPLLAACGSVSPVSLAQLAYGEERGFARSSCPAQNGQEEKWLNTLLPILKEKRTLLLDTGPRQADSGAKEAGIQPARSLASLLIRLLSRPETAPYTPMIIGGDTLACFLELLNAVKIELEGEACSGVPVFRAEAEGKAFRMLSKSGGFGEADILVRILQPK